LPLGHNKVGIVQLINIKEWEKEITTRPIAIIVYKIENKVTTATAHFTPIWPHLIGSNAFSISNRFISVHS